MLVSITKKLLDRFGLQVRRVPAGGAERYDTATTYEVALNCLLGNADKLILIVIGANDGVTNDPLFPFIRKFPDRTRVTLVEPQPFLIPILESHYSFHKSCHIVNAAVGAGPTLTLYGIKRDYWRALKPGYAKRWPDYRAATGITSSSKAHVEDWIRRYFPNRRDLNQIIEPFHVPCAPLPDLLGQLNLASAIDVLQVDTEGADDLVIYACAIQTTQPRLIYFEADHLPGHRTRDLVAYLRGLGYFVILDGLNWLAIKNSPSAAGRADSVASLNDEGVA
jgi:FkbM family methyltransferase